MKDWLVHSQLTNKSGTHVSCSPTTSHHEYFNPKRITTLNPPVHSIYSQSYTQATSHNSSGFLFYGQPDKAQVSSRVYVWTATDGWMAMVWCPTGTDQFVCCLGQSPLSATGGAILHMYGTWNNLTNLFFVNIEVDTLFGTLNILPSLERTRPSKQLWS